MVTVGGSWAIGPPHNAEHGSANEATIKGVADILGRVAQEGLTLRLQLIGIQAVNNDLEAENVTAFADNVSAEPLLALFGSSFYGLTSTKAAEALAQNGPNKLPEPPAEEECCGCWGNFGSAQPKTPAPPKTPAWLNEHALHEDHRLVTALDSVTITRASRGAM